MKLKALMLAFAATLSMVFFAACGDDAKEATPTETMKNFMSAMSECDFAKAATFTSGAMSEEIAKMAEGIKEIEKQAGPMADKVKEQMKAEMSKKMAAAKLIKEEINGDTATITMLVDGKEEKTILKKINGTWMIVE